VQNWLAECRYGAAVALAAGFTDWNCTELQATRSGRDLDGKRLMMRGEREVWLRRAVVEVVMVKEKGKKVDMRLVKSYYGEDRWRRSIPSSGGERLELMMVWQGSATVDSREHQQEYGLTAWCFRYQPSSQPSSQPSELRAHEHKSASM
jgi:hypothetical protein